MNGRCVLLCLVCVLTATAIVTSPAAAAERPFTAVATAAAADGTAAATASDDTSGDRLCAAVNGHMPVTVLIDERLTPYVQRMLARSAAFRRQCQALATQSQVYVRVQIALTGLPGDVRAQSRVERMLAGPLLAFVRLAPSVNWSEWIGHEFEHIIELAEGMRRRDYQQGHDTWESARDVYESARAIAAGRAVRSEMGRRDLTADH